MSVTLSPMPHVEKTLVVVGTSIRKSPVMLRAYLASLDQQELPSETYFLYCFVLDSTDPEVKTILTEFLATRHGVLLEPEIGPRDFDDAHPVTHQWTGTAMERVGRNKNQILEWAVNQHANFVWLCDADLILDRTVYRSLSACHAPIACAVYWTHWHRPAQLAGQLHAAPQVWLEHPYELQGRGYDQAEFRRELVERQRLEVWGQGACTLMSVDVITKGVNFHYIEGVSRENMMGGEDRHFCLRAEGLHVQMVADAWPDIFHVYNPDQIADIPVMTERLWAPHPDQPQPGDWVSAVLESIEPVPLQNGQATMLPPVHFRGRLGSSPMLPELEERLQTMHRGTTTILGLHFPIHHPEPFLRGQRRLVRVTLVDCKPFGYAPIVEQELYVTTTADRVIDMTTLSERQATAMLAEAAICPS